MPFADSNGVRLYYETAGRGLPIVFVHEFMGDAGIWDAQMRYFSRRYRCIAFNARGYPPSDVPQSRSMYSQRAATGDIAKVMRHLGVRRAHVIGCSMGGYATLYFGFEHPGRAISLTAIGAGAGSVDRRAFLSASAATARRFERDGLAAAAASYRDAPNRSRIRAKDPRGYEEFWHRFSAHSAIGHANTIRGVTMRRPPIYAMERQLARLRVPTHLVIGDEDDALLEPAVFMKRVCPALRLSVVPSTGHVVNVEEPAQFNEITERFLALVESGRWRPRDRRAHPSTVERRRHANAAP